MRHRRLPRVDLPHHTYYLTCCTHDRRPLFRAPDSVQMLLGLYAGYRDRGDMRLHGYVVMPEHYHVLLALRDEPSISSLVRNVHREFARRWRARGGSWAGDVAPALRAGLRGRIWQRRFYDHVIRDEQDWRTKLTYIHDNPVRGGLVSNPMEYPWSSARFWETGSGTVACDGIVW